MDENNPLQPTTPNLAPEMPAEPLPESPTESLTTQETIQPSDDSVNFNTESITPSEPEQEPMVSASSEAPVFAPTETPKKKSNVLTLVFALIAVLGICFGVYGMFLQPAKEKTVYKTIEKECDCSEEVEAATKEPTNCAQPTQDEEETPSETQDNNSSENEENNDSKPVQNTEEK